MNTFAGDVREGMEVMGLDGVMLGTVGDVQAEHEADVTAHEGAARISQSSADSDDTFPVRVGETSLHVPFEAIVILFPGQTLTVSCTADECRARYGT